VMHGAAAAEPPSVGQPGGEERPFARSLRTGVALELAAPCHARSLALSAGRSASRVRSASGVTRSVGGRAPARHGWRRRRTPRLHPQRFAPGGRCARRARGRSPSRRTGASLPFRPAHLPRPRRVVSLHSMRRPAPAAFRVSRGAGARGQGRRLPARGRCARAAGCPTSGCSCRPPGLGAVRRGCSAAAAPRACIGGGRGGILGATRGGRS
jgi:hypothetical protein